MALHETHAVQQGIAGREGWMHAYSAVAGSWNASSAFLGTLNNVTASLPRAKKLRTHEEKQWRVC